MNYLGDFQLSIFRLSNQFVCLFNINLYIYYNLIYRNPKAVGLFFKFWLIAVKFNLSSDSKMILKTTVNQKLLLELIYLFSENLYCRALN